MNLKDTTTTNATSCCCCCCHGNPSVEQHFDFHGCQQLNTNNPCKKLFWSIVLLTSTICMLIAIGCEVWPLLGNRPEKGQNKDGRLDDFHEVFPEKPNDPPTLTFAFTICNLNQMRLSQLVFNDWPVALDEVTTESISGQNDERTVSGWKDVKESVRDVLQKSGHRVEDMLVSCSTTTSPCSTHNFTSVFTHLGLCYYMESNTHRISLTLNPEIYEVTNQHGGPSSGIVIIPGHLPIPESSFQNGATDETHHKHKRSINDDDEEDGSEKLNVFFKGNAKNNNEINEGDNKKNRNKNNYDENKNNYEKNNYQQQRQPITQRTNINHHGNMNSNQGSHKNQITHSNQYEDLHSNHIPTFFLLNRPLLHLTPGFKVQAYLTLLKQIDGCYIQANNIKNNNNNNNRINDNNIKNNNNNNNRINDNNIKNNNNDNFNDGDNGENNHLISNKNNNKVHQYNKNKNNDNINNNNNSDENGESDRNPNENDYKNGIKNNNKDGLVDNVNGGDEEGKLVKDRKTYFNKRNNNNIDLNNQDNKNNKNNKNKINKKGKSNNDNNNDIVEVCNSHCASEYVSAKCGCYPFWSAGFVGRCSMYKHKICVEKQMDILSEKLFQLCSNCYDLHVQPPSTSSSSSSSSSSTSSPLICHYSQTYQWLTSLTNQPINAATYFLTTSVSSSSFSASHSSSSFKHHLSNRQSQINQNSHLLSSFLPSSSSSSSLSSSSSTSYGLPPSPSFSSSSFFSSPPLSPFLSFPSSSSSSFPSSSSSSSSETMETKISKNKCSAVNLIFQTSAKTRSRDSHVIMAMTSSTKMARDWYEEIKEGFKMVTSWVEEARIEMIGRMEVHTKVGLRGLQEQFQDWFGTPFERVNKQLLQLLWRESGVVAAEVQRAAKHLRFVSEPLSRKILFHSVSNLLSNHLEITISASNNFSSLHRSLKAPILSHPYFPPYALLSSHSNWQQLLQQIESNAAGLIEPIINLKEQLQALFKQQSFNQSQLILDINAITTRSTLIQQQADVIQRDVIEATKRHLTERIEVFEFFNNTLNNISKEISKNIIIITTQPITSHLDVLFSFCQISDQFLLQKIKKSQLFSPQNEISLRQALTNLKSYYEKINMATGSYLMTSLNALSRVLTDIWREMISEKQLKNFYVNIYNDISELAVWQQQQQNFQQNDQQQKFQHMINIFNKMILKLGINNPSTNNPQNIDTKQLLQRLNSDLHTNIDREANIKETIHHATSIIAQHPFDKIWVQLITSYDDVIKIFADVRAWCEEDAAKLYLFVCFFM